MQFRFPWWCCFAWLIAFTGNSRSQDWLDRTDELLSIQTSDAQFRSQLSGLFDLELNSIDQNPPDLIFTSDALFFQPRLSLFLDSQLGPHFYSLVQARFDRGFDPGSEKDGDVRADEYLLRYTPFDDARLNVQAGKFATLIGGWVERHDSWHNPFINAPLPYGNMTTISDAGTAPSAPAFLARRRIPDIKTAWLPVIWGPAYATGGAAFGSVGPVQYAVEVKNAVPSARPEAWDPNDRLWENPTIGGRLGCRPNAAWNFGLSGSEGAYLRSSAQSSLPQGSEIDDYRQHLLGADASFAAGHWQVWSELFLSRFEVPRVDDADTAVYYLEVRYKVTPQFFVATRWNQQFFGDVSDGSGGKQPWDNDLWRAEVALGYRLTRHIQIKLQYSRSHQDGTFQQGENFAGAQVTVKF